jgi:hypothetical protein
LRKGIARLDRIPQGGRRSHLAAELKSALGLVRDGGQRLWSRISIRLCCLAREIRIFRIGKAYRGPARPINVLLLTPAAYGPQPPTQSCSILDRPRGRAKMASEGAARARQQSRAYNTPRIKPMPVSMMRAATSAARPCGSLSGTNSVRKNPAMRPFLATPCSRSSRSR